MKYTALTNALAIVFALASGISSASPVDVEERAVTSPIDPIIRPAYELCAAASSALQIPTLPGNLDLSALGMKRETLNPATPLLGRKYDVVPGSRGQIAKGGDAFYPIGSNVGPCLVLSFGGSYFNALLVTGNPFRILFPISVVGNDWTKATTVCQSACDHYLRFQSVYAGGPATCNAINPWRSSPPTGDPFKPFGDFVICDMYPNKFITSDIKLPTPKYVQNGVMANARPITII